MKKILGITFFSIVSIFLILFFIFIISIKTRITHTFNTSVYDEPTKKPVPFATVIFSYSRGWSGGCGSKEYFTTDKDGKLEIKSTKEFCMNEAYAPGYNRNGLKDIVSSEIYLRSDLNSSFSKIELK